MKKRLLKMAGILMLLASGGTAGVLATLKRTLGSLRKERFIAEKHLKLYLMMNQWVQLKQQGRALTSYFAERGYRKIAIYGMNYVGHTLLKELENSEVHVEYAIDKNAADLKSEVKIIPPDEALPDVDIIVVTPIAYYNDIKIVLEQKVICPIVSIEGIICECERGMGHE